MGRKWWKKHKRRQQKAQKQAQAKGKNVTPKVTHVHKPNFAAPPCHDGVVGVFRKGKLAFWAGKARDVHMWNDWDMVICFSDKQSQWEDNDPRPAFTYNEQAKQLLSPDLFVASPRAPFIGLDWPDYGRPGFSRVWWDTLLADLMRIDKEEVNVALCCTGGHGRTGSALAILHGLCWPTAQDDPVEMVRRIYCTNCVESGSQIEYIEEILERPIKATANWATTGTRNTPSNSGYYSQYEIGDHKPQGSAAATKLAELETAASLGLPANKDARDIIQKAIEAREDREDGDEEYWANEEFIPFGANQFKEGFIYSPITNAAGDIVGWSEKKDVAI